jgi:hypothetical protein
MRSFDMESIKIIIVLFFVSFTVSCSSTYDVRYDFDPQTDFSVYKTFNWMEVPNKAGISGLVIQRVKNAVNAELEAKGLVMASNNPDLLIAEHLGKDVQVQIVDWGYEYGRRGYRGRGYGRRYGGPRNVSAYKYEEGTLILDFVDATTKKMIWRGVATAEVQNPDTPEKSQKLANEAVKEILKDYPPSSKTD